jgi:hypothetical protein
VNSSCFDLDSLLLAESCFSLVSRIALVLMIDPESCSPAASWGRAMPLSPEVPAIGGLQAPELCWYEAVVVGLMIDDLDSLRACCTCLKSLTCDLNLFSWCGLACLMNTIAC